MAGNMNLLLKKFGKAFKNILLFLLLLGIIFLVFLFSDTIFKYIIHGQSFYQVHLGDKEYKKGDFQEAVEYYNKALSLYPKHIKARYNLANIYVTFEDFPGAIKEYKTVLKYDPAYLNAGISLGIVLSEEFLKFDEAIKEYKKVIKTKTKIINIPFLYDNREQIINAKAIAYYNMGLAYRDKSMLFTTDSANYRDLLLKAIESYKGSLALNSDNYDAQYNLALTNHLLGLYTKALAGYCQALLIAPLNYEAHYNLAVLLRQKNLYKEAFEEFKDAGSLMSYRGDTYKAAYIYSMLNEVSQMAIAEYGYEPKKLVKRLDTKLKIHSLSYSDITLDDLENAIIKRLKTTSICKNYLKRF